MLSLPVCIAAAVLVSLGILTSAADLYSPEAIEGMAQLQGCSDEVNYAFQGLREEYKHKNHILSAYLKYLEVYDAIRHTDCDKPEPPEEDDKEVIEVFVNECVDALPRTQLTKFNDKITQTKHTVQLIDDELRRIDVECHEDANTCQDRKTQVLNELEKFLSAELIKDCKHDGSQIISSAKNSFQMCFKEETEGILKELVDATKLLNSCLETKTVIEKQKRKDE